MILDHTHGVANNNCDHPHCQTTFDRYRKRWRLDHDRGIARTVDATDVRNHIATLQGLGWTQRAIGAAADINHHTISKIRSGQQQRIRHESATAVLAVDPRALPRVVSPGASTVFVPKLGTVRRIEALLVIGWPHVEQRTRSSVVTSAVLRLNGSHVTRVTHERIATLYRQLSGRPGPSAAARRQAAARGYLSPAAWHDIDRDPAPDLGDLPPEPQGINENVVRRLLAGELVAATREERLRVVELWPTTGRPLNDLTRLTGWTLDRYREAS